VIQEGGIAVIFT